MCRAEREELLGKRKWDQGRNFAIFKPKKLGRNWNFFLVKIILHVLILGKKNSSNFGFEFFFKIILEKKTLVEDGMTS